MKQGSVKIIYCSQNAENITASAGRISTTAGSANQIYEKSAEKSRAENQNLIRKIISSGHTSVLEHAFVNLSFDNVSVFIEQFMIEFRLASFTVKSRRYVDFGSMGYVMPDFRRYGQNAGRMQALYQAHMEHLFEVYNELAAHGIPKEDARFVLPYSFRSNFYCTVNARELLKIVNEMVWGRGKAYPEIAALGTSIVKQCEEALPFLQFGKPEYSTAEALAWNARMTDGIENHTESVVLLNGPQDPEEIICRAAVLQSGHADWNSVDVKDPLIQKKIIKDILSHSRKRELEQAHFTILFPSVSLAGVTHLVRHRMQSAVVPEYISICGFERYIMPKSIAGSGLEMETRFREAFAESKQTAEQLRSMGLAQPDQAYLLLSGLTVPVLTTMNANELFTFIRLRSCSRAQWEIRTYAAELLKILRDRHPVLFSMYGPSCYVTGACPEGKLSCGQSEQIKRSFAGF